MTAPQQRLADVLLELVDNGLHERVSSDVPALLAKGCVELLDGCTAATVLVRLPGEAATATGSDPAVDLLEREALDWQEGPAYDALRASAPLAVTFGTCSTRLRWPHYTPRVLRLRLARAVSLPLLPCPGSREAIGALALLGVRPLTPPVLKLAQSLTDVAATVLRHAHDTRGARSRAGQLEHALTSRVVIEQAKGVIATRLSLSMDDAFALLRNHTRSHQRPLADTAQDVVEGRLLLPPHCVAREAESGAGPTRCATTAVVKAVGSRP